MINLHISMPLAEDRAAGSKPQQWARCGILVQAMIVEYGIQPSRKRMGILPKRVHYLLHDE